jgi:hypothetical protein
VANTTRRQQRAPRAVQLEQPAHAVDQPGRAGGRQRDAEQGEQVGDGRRVPAERQPVVPHQPVPGAEQNRHHRRLVAYHRAVPPASGRWNFRRVSKNCVWSMAGVSCSTSACVVASRPARRR